MAPQNRPDLSMNHRRLIPNPNPNRTINCPTEPHNTPISISFYQALKVVHRRCVDTSLLFPHPRGYPLRLKLKTLAGNYFHTAFHLRILSLTTLSPHPCNWNSFIHQTTIVADHLHISIQKHHSGTPAGGHDSVEDASTAMRLTLLKMERGR